MLFRFNIKSTLSVQNKKLKVKMLYFNIIIAIQSS